jgi:hypothetical protein
MTTGEKPGGKFQKGDDPRRHALTRAERRRGYANALLHHDPYVAAWVFRKIRGLYRRKRRAGKPAKRPR